MLPLSVCAFAQTEPTILETVAWLKKKMEQGVLTVNVDYIEKGCKLCFSVKSPTSNLWCVLLSNIKLDNIVSGETGDGGRGFNLEARDGLKAVVIVSRDKMNYGKETGSDKHYYFYFKPTANSPTFDNEMSEAINRLAKNCSK